MATEAQRRSKQHISVPKEFPIFLFLLALCCVLALTTDTFFSASNLKVLGGDAAAIGIMSVAMTAVIITGGIDLSVAAILSLSALVGIGIIARGDVLLGCAAAIGTGIGCGAFNGALITALRIPPIIATLGTLYIFQSGATLLSGGQCIILQRNDVAFLGRGFAPLLLMLVVFAIGVLAMRLAQVGRHIFAIGGNEQSARLAGISEWKIKMGVYAASGCLAAVAGLVMIGISGTFQANDALGYELAVIAAVVIGGTSIAGGEGSVVGTMIGVAISTVLRNGAILLGLDARWTQAVVGAALFLAVLVDKLRRR